MFFRRETRVCPHSAKVRMTSLGSIRTALKPASVSNTLKAEFCVDALNEAVHKSSFTPKNE